jgi:DNA-binding MarR family transcriptional regulator
MSPKSHHPPPAETAEQPVFVNYQALAEWRYRIRKFLAFSEEAARAVGLAPQHHQVLLAIKGLPSAMAPTIRVLAERMTVQPHSMVELLDRLEAKGLVRRLQKKEDGREVRAAITAKGERLLEQLSVEHSRELQSAGPALVQALLDVIEPQRPTRIE